MTTYKGILTNNGKALIAGATINNKINYSHIAVGDGNGSVPGPSETRNTLVNEKARIALNVVEINPNNTNQIVCEAIIPSNIGGFFIRELGLYAGNTMIVNASYPPTYKPLIDEGGAREINIKLIINIQNSEVIALYLDDSLIYATREWVNNNFIKRSEIIDNLSTDDSTKPVSSRQAKLLNENKLSIWGGTMYGQLTLANKTWNLVGNDVWIGDNDVAGALCLKPESSEVAGIAFFNKENELISILTPYKYGGNAETATKLATARKVGGVSFDGSTDINLPGVNQDGNQNTSGNAATASKLQIPRKINNVNFDGSQDITIKDDTKLPISGGTLTGQLNFANQTWNLVGNDVWIGDNDVAGALCLKPESSEVAGIAFFNKENELISILTPYKYGGNAETATKLATARKVGGVSFDGSTDINLPGVNQDGNQNTSGNAATASKLQIPRKINNVNFDGSQDITIKDDTKLPISGGTLTGQLNFANQTWNLVGNDVWIGDNDVAGALCLKPESSEVAGIAFFNKENELISILTPYKYGGNAETATKLATARKVGGVSFDGSTDINLPGVNQDGNQNTSGNAATASKLQIPRKIEITGASSGNTTFDGTTDISISTTLEGFISQKSPNGYMKIPQSDGSILIIQWGIHTGGGSYSTPRNHSFPIVFPRECLSLTATTNALFSNRFTSVGNVKKEGFSSINSGNADDAFNWIAIGN